MVERLISHRGNLAGPSAETENRPEQIRAALAAGFDVEIDLNVVGDRLLLGHDCPQYEVGVDFLLQPGLWIHCKSIEAVALMSRQTGGHHFFHDRDDCTLTSRGFIWTYPRDLLLTDRSVAVLPERVPGWNLTDAYAACTDFPTEYRAILAAGLP